MAWIKSEQAIERHPKTLDLMSRMSWDLDTTIAKLHRFWWWCVDYADDGDLRKHNDARIGAAVGLNGDAAKQFKDALVQSCWIDREPYFRVHDWWDHAGPFLISKYKNRKEIWKKIRAAYQDNSCKEVTDTKIDRKKPTNQDGGLARDDPQPQEQAPHGRDLDGNAFIPVSLQTPEFIVAWKRWLATKMEERGKPLPPLKQEAQIKQCETWGSDYAVQAITYSIRQDYKGLCEEKGRNGRVDHSTRRKIPTEQDG